VTGSGFRMTPEADLSPAAWLALIGEGCAIEKRPAQDAVALPYFLRVQQSHATMQSFLKD
jgi:hypothetical protein